MCGQHLALLPCNIDVVRELASLLRSGQDTTCISGKGRKRDLGVDVEQ